MNPRLRAAVLGIAILVVGALALRAGPATAAKDGDVFPTMSPDGLFPPVTMKLRTAASMIRWHLGSRPDAVNGKPALAARNLAYFEWFVAELARTPYSEVAQFEIIELQEARRKVRGGLGLSPQATPEQAVATLAALWRSFERGDEARTAALLRANIFTADSAAVRQRLTNLRVTRQTSIAIVRAVDSLFGTNRVQDDCQSAAMGCQ